MTTQEQANATLDDATIKQFSFKPGPVQQIAVRIILAALNSPSMTFWPDDVDFTDVEDKDANAIGLSFRRLRAVGLIERLQLNKPSSIKGAARADDL